MTRLLPRFVRIKTLANGAVAFYWDLTGYYRGLGCSIPGEPLGTDYVTACGEDGNGGRAAALNALFDEWRRGRSGEPVEGLVRYGTVDWLFREYKQTKAYLEKVSQRSRRDYERTMLLVTDLITKKGDRVGDRKVKAVTPVSADKIYEDHRWSTRAATAPGRKGCRLVRTRVERRAPSLSRCFQSRISRTRGAV